MEGEHPAAGLLHALGVGIEVGRGDAARGGVELVGVKGALVAPSVEVDKGIAVAHLDVAAIGVLCRERGVDFIPHSHGSRHLEGLRFGSFG